MFIKSILLFILVGCIASCSNNNAKSGDFQKETAALVRMFENSNSGAQLNLNIYKKVMIVPIDMGCETCIQKCLDFASTSQGRENLIILSSQTHGYFRNRLLEFKHELADYKRESVVLDTLNYCFTSGLTDITPKIYQLDNGEITSMILLYAVNIDDDLNKLKEN